jgi:hypothetical protein
MATKFSQFTAGATTANTLVVGFDSNLKIQTISILYHN